MIKYLDDNKNIWINDENIRTSVWHNRQWPNKWEPQEIGGLVRGEIGRPGFKFDFFKFIIHHFNLWFLFSTHGLSFPVVESWFLISNDDLSAVYEAVEGAIEDD